MTGSFADPEYIFPGGPGQPITWPAPSLPPQTNDPGQWSPVYNPAHTSNAVVQALVNGIISGQLAPSDVSAQWLPFVQAALNEQGYGISTPPPVQPEIHNPEIPDETGYQPTWTQNQDDPPDGWEWYDHDNDPTTDDVFGPPPNNTQEPADPVDPGEDDTGGGSSGRPPPPDNSGNWWWDATQGLWVWIFGGNPDPDPGGNGSGTGGNDPLPDTSGTPPDGGDNPADPLPDDDDQGNPNFPFPFPGEDDDDDTGDDVSQGGFFNSIGDFLNSQTVDLDFSDLLSQTLNFGIDEAVADRYRDAVNDQLDFNREIYDLNTSKFQPFYDMGVRGIPGTDIEARTNPALKDTRAENLSLDPFVNVAGPAAGTQADANTVAVNENSPFDLSDPGLKYLLDTGRKAIEDSAVASGKLKSGGTLEALQDLGIGAAALRAPQLQQIYSARDNLNLAADDLRYGQARTNQTDDFTQQLASAAYESDQGASNVMRGLAVNDQNYQQLYGQNQEALFADDQAYRQLYNLVAGVGQPSAAGQASAGNVFMGYAQPALEFGADLTGAQSMDYAARLKELFGI